MNDSSEPGGAASSSASPGVSTIWPDSLIQPTRPPHLAYLDLNHWINLAKVQRGHKDGVRYGPLFEACKAAREEGRFAFVLTDSLFAEISSIRDPKQRQALAEVIETLTGFNYLLGRPEVMRLELQSSLNAATGVQISRYKPTLLVKRGVLHAFGRVGGLKIRDKSGADITEIVRQEKGSEQFDPWLNNLELKAERMLLAGPSDTEIPALTAAGYAPEVARATTERRAEQEREQVQRFNDSDKNWRRSRLRDAISAREVNIELAGMLTEELMLRGLDFGEAIGGTLEGARSLVLSMPSTAVSIELKTRYHQDGNKRWSVNDIHDIDALSIAVPYCDVVFTDAAARSALVHAHLDRAMNTELPRTPAELVAILSA